MSVAVAPGQILDGKYRLAEEVVAQACLRLLRPLMSKQKTPIDKAHRQKIEQAYLITMRRHAELSQEQLASVLKHPDKLSTPCLFEARSMQSWYGIDSVSRLEKIMKEHVR